MLVAGRLLTLALQFALWLLACFVEFNCADAGFHSARDFFKKLTQVISHPLKGWPPPLGIETFQDRDIESVYIYDSRSIYSCIP